MTLQSAHRKLACWIAAVAILMAALAPTIAHALGSQGVAAWAEICTTQGPKWVQSEADAGAESAPVGGHVLEHCPYCSLHPDSVSLAPAPLLGLPAADPARVVPRAFLAAPRTLHAWVSAQPRAPPQRA